MKNKAFFFDGVSALKQEIFVNISSDHLEILDSEGFPFLHWPYDEITLVDQIAESGIARFSHPESPDALLVVEDRLLLASIKKAIPKLFPSSRQSAKKLVGMVAGILIALVGGFYFLSFSVDRLATLIPVSWEEPLARSSEKQILAFFAKGKGEEGLCKGAEGQNILRDMARHLSRAATPPIEANIRVIRSDVVNAFALPGGRVFLFKGLIDKAESEAEVAGVLAHELGHIQERHPLAGAVKQFALSTIVKAVSGESELAGLASQLASFSYTRAAEREADEIATRLLTISGYGTQGLAHFFKRLRKKGIELPAILSTHPSNTERINKLSQGAVSHPLAQPPNRIENLKTICD